MLSYERCIHGVAVASSWLHVDSIRERKLSVKLHYSKHGTGYTDIAHASRVPCEIWDKVTSGITYKSKDTISN
jgi:hypothetical protein